MSTHLRGLCFLVSVAAAVCASGGCYNSDELKAFLQKPRKPVSGVDYHVYPPDVISISSLRVPEVDEVSQKVRPDGKVNLPLLGEVFVAGMTPADIEEAIKAKASEYYEGVDATVVVTGYNSQKFYIFGQVGRPGPMAWTGKDTLLDALAKAQPTSLAWPERIVIVRGGEPQEGGNLPEKGSGLYMFTGVRPAEENKPRSKMTVNLMAMVESGDLSNNILLEPNDVIYCQPNPLAKVGLAIQNVLFPIRPAVETVTLPAQVAAP